jgi:hypothetical protein
MVLGMASAGIATSHLFALGDGDHFAPKIQPLVQI